MGCAFSPGMSVQVWSPSLSSLSPSPANGHWPEGLGRVSDRLVAHLESQGDRVEILRVTDGGCRVSIDRESESPDVLLLVHVRPEGLEVSVQVHGEEAGRMSPPRGLSWRQLIPLILGLAGWSPR